MLGGYEVEDVKLLGGCSEQSSEVANALEILDPDDPAIEVDRPVVAFTEEPFRLIVQLWAFRRVLGSRGTVPDLFDELLAGALFEVSLVVSTQGSMGGCEMASCHGQLEWSADLLPESDGLTEVVTSTLGVTVRKAEPALGEFGEAPLCCASVRTATWNVKWATPASHRGRSITGRFEALDADVIVATETGTSTVLPPDGYLAESGPDWGYEAPAGRRKVVLWSRRGWQQTTTLEEHGFPPGRFVTGITTNSGGTAVRVVGVCIPWSSAHVSTGRRDRTPWEDHLCFLESLARLPVELFDLPVVLAGDFNQRIPRARQPVGVFQALQRALDDRFEVATADCLAPPDDRTLIDHIAITRDFRPLAVEPFHGRDVSDHDGVVVDLDLVHRGS